MKNTEYFSFCEHNTYFMLQSFQIYTCRQVHTSVILWFRDNADRVHWKNSIELYRPTPAVCKNMITDAILMFATILMTSVNARAPVAARTRTYRLKRHPRYDNFFQILRVKSNECSTILLTYMLLLSTLAMKKRMSLAVKCWCYCRLLCLSINSVH